MGKGHRPPLALVVPQLSAREALVGPTLVREWARVQQVASLTPVREILVHELDEPLAMRGLQEMYELVNNYVFKAAEGFLCQL